VASVKRTRRLAIPAAELWRVVSDPYHLPRWWPRVTRVENVQGEGGRKRTRWTTVYETDRGRGVRADFRCVSASQPSHYVWEQEVANTPFERFMRSSRTEMRIDGDQGGSKLTIETVQRLRGISRLGSPMARSALRRQLDEALEGLEEILAPGGASG
jgi:uncharacterized protein YndB with AHSA1/START domain